MRGVLFTLLSAHHCILLLWLSIVSYVTRPGPGGINTEIVASSIIALVAVGQQVGGERVPRIC
jgi:hypothetical protein